MGTESSNRIASAAVSAKYSSDALLCMRDVNGAILLINEAWEGVSAIRPGELETLPLARPGASRGPREDPRDDGAGQRPTEGR